MTDVYWRVGRDEVLECGLGDGGKVAVASAVQWGAFVSVYTWSDSGWRRRDIDEIDDPRHATVLDTNEMVGMDLTAGSRGQPRRRRACGITEGERPARPRVAQ